MTDSVSSKRSVSWARLPVLLVGLALVLVLGLAAVVIFRPLVKAHLEENARKSHGMIITLPADSQPVHAVAFSPDGSLLACSCTVITIPGWENSVAATVWDVPRGTLLRTLQGEDYETTSVQFSPDGAKLAAANDNQILMWDLGTRAAPTVINGLHWKPGMSMTGWLRAAVFSHDGSRLATSGTDDSYNGQVIIWDLATRRPLFTLPGDK